MPSCSQEEFFQILTEIWDNLSVKGHVIRTFQKSGLLLVQRKPPQKRKKKSKVHIYLKTFTFYFYFLKRTSNTKCQIVNKTYESYKI